jgi:probable O-glycosylation ligase (exosortase A-associated)
MRELLLYAMLPVIAALGLMQPFYGVMIYGAINIVRPEMLFWGASTGSILFRVSIITAMLGFFLFGKNHTAPFRRRELWLILWICLAIVASVEFASLPAPERIWDYVEEFFKILIFAWLILGLVVERKEILLFENFLLGTATFLALWGCDQHFRGNDRLEGLGGHAFSDSNGVAAFGVLFLLVALNKVLTAPNIRQRCFGIVSTVLLIMMIIFTQSRGGFIAMICGALYLLLYARKRKFLVVCMVVFTLLALQFVSKDYKQRISSIGKYNEEQDYSAQSRQVLWQVGWMMFRDHPLMGVGFGNFARMKEAYKPALISTVEPELLEYSFSGYKVGHSTYFCQILAEGGLFLAIPYAWLIIGFFFQVHQARRARAVANSDRELMDMITGVAAGVFGYSVAILFIDSLPDVFLPMQVLVGSQLIRAWKTAGSSSTFEEVSQNAVA